MTQAISLVQGWNLIGFPSVGAPETAILFQSLSDQNKVERIIGTGEFYTFDSNALFNTLANLQPGDGYWVKMHEAGVLTVQNDAAGNGANGGTQPRQGGRRDKTCRTETASRDLSVRAGDELRGLQEIPLSAEDARSYFRVRLPE